MLKRLVNSAVVWSWALNGLRVASGVLLLPVLLRVLPEKDLGMYYVLLSLSALGPLMDFGFLNAIHRAVGYAMGGATELKAFGAAVAGASGAPNYPLLWKLLLATRILYRYLSLGLLLLLSPVGTILLYGHVHQTSDPLFTWIAWGLTLGAMGFELYSSWWNIFLRGMNEVLPSIRIYVYVYAIRILLATVLLLFGAGLLSVPIAALVTGVLARHFSRIGCLRLLSAHRAPQPEPKELRALVKTLWPNSWRVGLQFLSAYLTTNANALICLKVFGLAANAQYGLSVQLVNFLYGTSLVWTSVKWPLISQYRARQEIEPLRKLFWPRVWLQNVTFICLAAMTVPLAPEILEWLGTAKTVLPNPWLTLLAVLAFFEMQFSTWGSLIATENRLPFLRSTILTNIVGIALTVTLIQVSPFGIGGLVLGPLLSGLVFNFWHWPREGAKTLNTTWTRFMFSRNGRVG